MNSTVRLIFDKPAMEDFERFYQINSDPETNLFNPAGPMNFEIAEKDFNKMITHWKQHSFGTWAIKEKKNPQFIIGFGGLSHRLYGNEIKLNLGYRFDKDYWGKGYATELAKYAIEFGLNELNKKEIFAIVRPKHIASIKVLEKCNMKLSGELNDVEGKESSLIYIIKNNKLLPEK